MSIKDIRDSLNGESRKNFDNTLSKFKMSDNVTHDIIGFDDDKNFIIRSLFDAKPRIGLVIFKDGEIAKTLCY